MGLTRQQFSQIYRPLGPKPISLGINAGSGQSYQLGSGTIDLSIPIRGLRLVMKGRLVVGTAGFTTASVEGFLNMLNNITIQGINKRAGGNVTLWNLDGASLFTMQQLFSRREGFYGINSGSGLTEVAIPTTPFPTAWNPVGATGTYDYLIVFEVPFHPFGIPAWQRPGFFVRSDEWGDSLQISLTFGTQVGAGGNGALGTSAGTTTVTFSAYGSGTGNPTLDVYSLPVGMGPQFAGSVLPGLLSRAAVPLTTKVQTSGSAVDLLDLQKQATTRVILKVGTATAAPTFLTLSDAAVTTLGVLLGGNRNVRNKQDVYAHKSTVSSHYDTDFIPGYTCMDFIQSGNTDSAYPGDQVGSGASLQLVGDVTALTNGYAIIVQEQVLYRPDGSLYNPQGA